MDWDLDVAVRECLTLDRNQVKLSSNKWTWAECWRIFKENLVSIQ